MFRDKIRELKVPSEEPYYSLVLSFMNHSLLQNAGNFWNVELKKHMVDQFPYSLSQEEQNSDFDIRLHIDWELLLQRFQDVTSIKLTKEAELNIISHIGNNSSGTFVLLEPDIKKIGVSVSHLSIIYHAGTKEWFMLYLTSYYSG